MLGYVSMNDDNALLQILLTFIVASAAATYILTGKSKNEYSAKPKVTLKCRFFNFMLWPYQRFQLRSEFYPLEFSKLRKYAMKKTKLDDFGGKFHETSFEFAVSLANKTNYSPVGYAALQDFLKRLLITRLRIIEELKDKEMRLYIDKFPIRKPIFIVGLPRTGTTFLQRLLSLDPANTGPTTWELMDPVPRYKDDLRKDAKKRIKYCQKNIDMLLSLIPHLAEVHEMGAEIAEECTVLMGVDAPALVFNFHTLLEEQDEIFSWDWTEAYKNYYNGLQIIQHYRSLREEIPETRRWVLKAPPHLGVLNHLTAAFPDARIIWNHRDPKECLPSFASLIRAGQDICEGSGTIQLDVIGKHMITYAQNMYERGDKFFESVDKNSSCRGAHVLYEKLIHDPISTIKNLYNDFGYEFTKEYESNLMKFLVEDKLKRESMKGSKEKLHKYTMEEYGLTDSDINDKFAWYMDKYLSS